MSTTQDLVDYVSRVAATDFPQDVVEKASEVLVDTVGCSMGAYTSPPVKVLRREFSGKGGADTATIVGTDRRTAVEDAALINAAMARYLDYNDCYMSASAACHPSDHVMALVSVAESVGATGSDLLDAIVIAYEVEGRGLDAAPVRVNGFDYAAWGPYSSVAAVGTLMGLDDDEMADALGIAGASNNPLYISRRGEVSMWKGVAHPYVTHNAIQACQMARGGMSGPPSIFEGPFGFFEVVADEPVSFDLEVNPSEFRILETSIKSFACGYYIHSPVTGVLSLMKKHELEPSDIESIHVEMFDVAVEALATPEKWGTDLTRETADHSIPYTVAAAVVDGEVTPRQYEEDRLRAPEIHEVMDQITVEEDDALTDHRSTHPRHIPSETWITANGETYHRRIDSPLGHPDRPMTDEQIRQKFEDNCTPLLTEEQIETCYRRCRSVNRLESVEPILDSLVI